MRVLVEITQVFLDSSSSDIIEPMPTTNRNVIMFRILICMSARLGSFNDLRPFWALYSQQILFQ
jgi:hypothetical protein